MKPLPEVPVAEPLAHTSLIRSWIDQRTGLTSIIRGACDEPIPGGPRWAYVLGSGLLFLLVSQIVTGIALAVYYVPAANDAHVTVAYIIKVVSGGSFLRSLHSYGASAFIVVLLLHITQTLFYGSYKGRRELVWIAGCGLFALLLGMAFTGYLLPWDQKAYFATAVGTNVMGEVPGGNIVRQLMLGGNRLGTVTLSRFFVLHVFVLPALIIALAAAHVFLFRKAGPAGPISEDPVNPKLPTEMFYPGQFLQDALFAALLMGILAALAYFYPVPLGPVGNPADTNYLPRPEWYFLPLFQWLKFWPGKTALIGMAVLPAIVTLLFVGVPFFDRGLERRPSRRLVTIGIFCFVLGGMVAFGVLSRIQDRHDPIVSRQMAKQEGEVRAFMNQPFEPQVTRASMTPAVPPAPPPPATTTSATPKPPAVSQGEAGIPSSKKKGAPPATAALSAVALHGKDLFHSMNCVNCHGEEGVGTIMAPALAGLGEKWTADEISAFIQMPSVAAQSIGMPAVSEGPDLQALVAYIKSLKP